MYRPFQTVLQKIVPYTIKVQILIFLLLFFQQTLQQLSQDRACLLTAYRYAKLRDGLTNYLLLLSKNKL